MTAVKEMIAEKGAAFRKEVHQKAQMKQNVRVKNSVSISQLEEELADKIFDNEDSELDISSNSIDSESEADSESNQSESNQSHLQVFAENSKDAQEQD